MWVHSLSATPNALFHRPRRWYDERVGSRLEQEIATYEMNRARLYDEHPGKFVLIKGDQIIDYFDDELAGITAGHEKFGNEAFLVRVISDSQTPVLFTSLYIAASDA